MITPAGQRKATLDIAALDVFRATITFNSLIAQHGAVVVADCVLTAQTGFTLNLSTWVNSNTALKVIMTAPATPGVNYPALDMAIKFTDESELLHFYLYVNLQ